VFCDIPVALEQQLAKRMLCQGGFALSEIACEREQRTVPQSPAGDHGRRTYGRRARRPRFGEPRNDLGRTQLKKATIEASSLVSLAARVGY
jgi:hypothetical protein